MSVCDCRRCGAYKAGDTSTGLCESCEEQDHEDHGKGCDHSDYD